MSISRLTDGGVRIYETPQQSVHALNIGRTHFGSSFYVGNEVTVFRDFANSAQLFRNNFYEIGLYLNTDNSSIQIDDHAYQSNGDPILSFVSPLQLQSYYFSPATAKKARFYIVFIAREVIEDLRVSMNSLPFFQRSGKQVFNINKSVAKELSGLLQNMVDDYSNWSTLGEQVLKSYLEIILVRCVQRLDLPITNSSPKQALITKFLDLLNQDKLAGKTAKFYAAKLLLSEKQLNSLLRKSFGKTSLGLIHEVLLSKAKALLLQSQMTIAEVAYELGYEEQAHFSRFFKAKSGHSPLEYRQKVLNW